MMAQIEKNSAFSRELYPNVRDWKRAAPWTRSTRPNHFEAAYERTAHGAQSARVYVRDCYFLDADAATFEITSQLSRANAAKQKREQAARR